MASSSEISGPILEGCFGIDKPTGISSAQVIREVQDYFRPSKTFEPYFEREKILKVKNLDIRRKKTKKERMGLNVKMGHGGTLDPLATGVLVLGVGSGTKSLSKFLECTKSYEAVLLFGAATDTYDTEGKIVARKGYKHITKEQVKTALQQYRGKIMQKPPIFSALRMNGKRLYEYAREGLELPEEIKERPVEVLELEMLEWMDGGSHKWHWPKSEADNVEMKFAEKVLKLEGTDRVSPPPEDNTAEKKEENTTDGAKRKKDEADLDNAASTEFSAKRAKPSSGEKQKDDNQTSDVPAEKEAEESREPCDAPAVRIRMTVTSGFYVRTLCHDLGAAVGSLGCMASLVRSRQGEFELGRNVLPFDDLAKGEDVWGPKVKGLLQDWEKEKSSDN